MSDDKHDDNHEHILPNQTGLKILLALLALTIITVVTSRIDLGFMNAPIAIFIACLKAMLVVLYFMGMKYDSNDNRVFFGSSFVFFAIFVVLTSADVFTRGDWKVPDNMATGGNSGGPKIPKFWIPSEATKAHGKELYKSQACFTCHGDKGEGNGIAAGSLNPRNFTKEDGWKNGRKATQIVGTLTTGLGSMPSFNNLSLEDRFSLAAFVQAFGPAAPADSPEDIKKVGVKDPTKDDGGLGSGEEQKKSVPIDFAIDRYVESQK